MAIRPKALSTVDSDHWSESSSPAVSAKRERKSVRIIPGSLHLSPRGLGREDRFEWAIKPGAEREVVMKVKNTTYDKASHSHRTPRFRHDAVGLTP